jgi:hypothetical protein
MIDEGGDNDGDCLAVAMARSRVAISPPLKLPL